MALATVIYSRGDLIHKESPFVYCLSSKNRLERCDFCFIKGSLFKCSACKYVFYCNVACQKSGWNTHKHECCNLKQISPKIVPDSARLLARLIRLLQNGGNAKQIFYGPNKRIRMFKDLMSHYSDIKKDSSRLEHFTSLYGVLVEFFHNKDLPNYAELMGMYGRMCINSFTIMDDEMQTLGTAIYLGASVFDHSCDPNAIALFEGTTLYIRAIKTLSSTNWSNVFISYIDVLNTTQNRREELLKLYYFTCQCVKCVQLDPPEILAASCPNTNCINCISSTDINCSKCGEHISKEFKQNFEEVMDFTEMHLKQMEQLAYIDVCFICIERQKRVLHKFNIKHLITLDLVFHSCVNLAKWAQAVKFGLELVNAYDKYYGKLHPLTGILHLKIGKILLYQGETNTSLKHLHNALDILKITHGPNSRLVAKELKSLLKQAAYELS